MSRIRKLPAYDRSLGGVMLSANEVVLAPMRPKLREHNLTEPQWRVLRVINDLGTTSATTLARSGLLHAPSVTRILEELGERRLVLRETDPNDRRRALVTLSDQGREVVKDISRVVRRTLQEYSDIFGAARLENLINELLALSAALKRVG